MAHDPLEGEIRLAGAREGERVVVRMNYFPAWRARAGGRDVPLFADENASAGQLAFVAPSSGDYTVHLEYPRRRWLIAFSLAALLAGGILMSREVDGRKRLRKGVPGTKSPGQR